MVGLTSPLFVLCVNSGSSSLKWALYRNDDGVLGRLGWGAVEGIGGDDGRRWVRMASEAAPDRPAVDDMVTVADHRAAVSSMVAALADAGLPEPDATGHRLVHGGADHVAPERVDDALLVDLRRAVPLAPLHLPAEMAALDQVAEHWPGRPAVVCFDTAFHATLPEPAHTYALPERLRAAGLRRFGFHGLSYEYVVDTVGAAALGRAVIAHLGNGASMCAVLDGRSVDTTMGFTPTGGLVMGSRFGDVDPGVLIHAMRADGLDADGLEHLVNFECGLLGLSGTTGDMRQLLAARSTDPAAALAVEVFCRTTAKHAGALVTVLGGLDTLVFTGGIGERAAPVRSHIAGRLAHLGVVVDAGRNDRSEPVISTDGAPVTIRVVPTDEDLMVGRHTIEVLTED